MILLNDFPRKSQLSHESDSPLYPFRKEYGALSFPSHPIRCFDEGRITLWKLFQARSQ